MQIIRKKCRKKQKIKKVQRLRWTLRSNICPIVANKNAKRQLSLQIIRQNDHASFYLCGLLETYYSLKTFLISDKITRKSVFSFIFSF